MSAGIKGMCQCASLLAVYEDSMILKNDFYYLLVVFLTKSEECLLYMWQYWLFDFLKPLSLNTLEILII